MTTAFATHLYTLQGPELALTSQNVLLEKKLLSWRASGHSHPQCLSVASEARVGSRIPHFSSLGLTPEAHFALAFGFWQFVSLFCLLLFQMALRKTNGRREGGREAGYAFQ